MQVNIYHASAAIFGGAMFASDKAQYVQRQFDNYEKIATVHIDAGGSITSTLEQAYRDTNSVDFNWFEGDNVILENEGSKHRSTSVGDVLEINGLKYVVDSFGFSFVDDPNASAELFDSYDDETDIGSGNTLAF